MLLNECNTANMAKRSGIQLDNNLQELKRQSINIHNLWKEMGRLHYGVVNNERIRVKSFTKGI